MKSPFRRSPRKSAASLALPVCKSERLLPLAARLAAILGLTLGLAATAGAAPVPPAFPGAQGFGAVAIGGRGGAVVHVTTLAAEGPGSLASALGDGAGPRIVVFDVGGIIRLRDELRLPGRVTILGQTAPGDGITIEGARLVVTGDDVIVRGLHLRPGKGKGQDKGARDGLSVGVEDRVVRRVMIDGNSITWATDENLSTWFEVEDVTFSNNIIAEGLYDAGHPEGRHSMGLLVGQDGNRVSILRNALVSNFWRNPQVERSAAVEIVNNLIYNYGPGGILVSQGPARVDVIGNVLIAGKDTPDPDRREAIEIKDNGPESAFHLADNQTPLGPDVARGAGLGRASPSPVVAPLSGTRALPSERVLAHVLAHAGARPQDRDPVDRRILGEIVFARGDVTSRTWAGYEWRPAPARWPEGRDADGDAVPDADEARLGSDPSRPDSHLIDPVSGYAYVELYANGLVALPSATSP